VDGRLNARELPLSRVFSDDFVFSIPNYQRPYSWGVEQASELLDDLLTFTDRHLGSGSSSSPYFLGSIVLIKGAGPPAEVVDGQQRLATLTILLAALRALANREDGGQLTPFLCERGNRYSGARDRYRLTLRDRDAAFFRDHVQKEGGIDLMRSLGERLTDSQRNLRDVARLFLSRLEGITEERRQDLGTFVLRNCYLVVVSTPDLDSAYRIFSVLNDRGLDLSPADILKAEIIGAIPEEDQQRYTRRWEDTEDDLGRDSFRDLFSHIRMIHRKSKPQDTLLKEFRNFVRPTSDPRHFVDATLLPMAESYGTILGASYDGDRRVGPVNSYLRWLNRVDNVDWIPPAMSYLARHQGNADGLLRFLADLERLASCLMVLRANVNRRIERYGRVMAAIENGEDLYAPDSPLGLSADERRKTLEALDGDLYNSVRVRLPVLLRLDEALSGGEARYDLKAVSVEHVLPQNPPPGSQWTRWFPEGEARASAVHRLGNLVLLSRIRNSRAQNFDFERKKSQYFTTGSTTPFALTSQVLQEHRWTPGVVSRRQRQLVSKLREVWRL
jgi:hypothetical protein